MFRSNPKHRQSAYLLLALASLAILAVVHAETGSSTDVSVDEIQKDTNAKATRNQDFDTCCQDSCRTDCGYKGIEEQECLDKGCCWDPYEFSGSGPWCYYKNCMDPSSDVCRAGELHIDCGNYKIQQDECEERGCCWSPVANSPPWCFFKNSPQKYSDCCADKVRPECGYCGIQGEECLERGCCWAPSEDEHDTWCFQKNCDVPPADICDPNAPRTDCGYVGVDQVVCEKGGCCWDPLPEGTEGPWCYYKNGLTESELDVHSAEASSCKPAPTENEAKREQHDASDAGRFTRKESEPVVI